MEKIKSQLETLNVPELNDSSSSSKTDDLAGVPKVQEMITQTVLSGIHIVSHLNWLGETTLVVLFSYFVLVLGLV